MKKEKEKQIPCSFYHYLHYTLIGMLLLGKNTRVISIKEWEDGMFQYRIPKQLRPVITKELELLGLIKRIDRQLIEVNDSTYQPEDLRCFYKEVCIF